MIIQIGPALRRIRGGKKTEFPRKAMSRRSKKSLLDSGSWLGVPCGAGDRAIVLSSNLPKHSWNRVDNETRSLAYQLVLSDSGESFPFTIDFDNDLVNHALRTHKPFSRWIDERLSYHLSGLERSLGYKLPYWFTVEISRTGVWHIHGSIGVSNNFIDEVEQLFKKVAGSSGTFAERHFVKVGEFDPKKRFRHLHGHLGWAAYSVKRLKITADSEPRIGSPIVCRGRLRTAARELWEGLRLEYRRGPGGVRLRKPAPERTETPASVEEIKFGALEASSPGYRSAAFSSAV